MWRALLARKLLALVALVGGAALVSAWRAGSVPTDGFEPGADTKNVSAMIAERQRLSGAVWLTPTDEAPVGVGSPRLAWYAARTGGEIERDIFATRLRISAAGIPTVVDDPVNLSRTPAGDEIILDADAGRLLYATRVAGLFQNAVLLDFTTPWVDSALPWSTRMLAGALANAAYGVAQGAVRWDFVLAEPVDRLGGELVGAGLILSPGAEGAITIDLSRGEATVQPKGGVRVLRATPISEEPLVLLADVLRQSKVVGRDRVMALERVALRMADWVRRQRHRLFPSRADKAPVVIAAALPAERFEAWPPPDFSVDGGLDGEGSWRPVEGVSAAASGMVVQTFTRVDVNRPYQKTWLIAFDMRRLGLHFVAGTRHPQSTTGARGEGRVAPGDRQRLVAAFNGGFKAEHGDFGAIEGRRVLVPPSAGLATVVTDVDGHAAVGIWDAEELARPWTALRQNLAPLVAGGVVNPSRSRNWGGVVADLDEARTPRSAMGVTASGVLVYGWSSATSAEHLGDAMVRAGVRFAIHLDMNPKHTGLEVYDTVAGGLAAHRAVPQMDHRLGRWLGSEARDFFYLSLAPGNPTRMPHRRDDWQPGEGIWRPAPVNGALVATSFVTGARVLGRRQVELTLLDVTRLRAHLVPGLAEAKPATGVPVADLALPGPPVVWLTGGLPAPRSKQGLVAAKRVWRAPVDGVMTLAVTDEGQVVLGRWGEARLLADREWAELIQGAALLEEGLPVDEANAGRDGMPVSAVGMVPPDRLVFATVPDGDRKALQRALRLAGAREAMLLGAYGTVETGEVRFFQATKQGLLMAQGRGDGLVPGRLSPGAATSLVFTGRAPDPRISIVETFGGRD